VTRGADQVPSWNWWGDGEGPPDPTAPPPREPWTPTGEPSYGSPPVDGWTHVQPRSDGLPYGQPPADAQPLGQPPADGMSTYGQRPVEVAPAEASETFSVPRQPAADDTAKFPASAFLETAIIPRLKRLPETPPSLAELAGRHGLTPAATRPRLRRYIADLWRYRQFIQTYANGRIVAQFGETRLGRVWQVLTPLVNAGVYFLIFGVVLGTRHGVHNFVGYLVVGIFIFTFTSNVVSSAVSSISGQLGLVRALQFPRASLPIAMVLMQLQNLAISLIVMVGIVLATGEPLNLEWVLLLPALVLQTLFSLGLGLAMARLGAKLVDLRQILPFLLRIWMYTSGVLYSVQVFTQQLPSWATPVLHANPALVYIELARLSVMEQVPVASSFRTLWIMGVVWALVAFVGGLIYFWRGEGQYGRG
jgi:teichoic acid transport system permease protein